MPWHPRGCPQLVIAPPAAAAQRGIGRQPRRSHHKPPQSTKVVRALVMPHPLGGRYRPTWTVGRAALTPYAPLPFAVGEAGLRPQFRLGCGQPSAGSGDTACTTCRVCLTRYTKSAPPHRAGLPRFGPRDAVDIGLNDLVPLCTPMVSQRPPKAPARARNLGCFVAV